MPKTGPPIHPRKKDAREYEKALRTYVMAPTVREIESIITRAGSTYEAIRMDIAAIPFDPRLEGLSEREARLFMTRVKKYHTERFKRSMRAYFGTRVDTLGDPEIATLIQRGIDDNVALIKTIPQRMHEGVRTRFSQIAADTPFDRQRVNQVLLEEYKSTGYNLRRLTRDQTNKQIGRLSEVRQTQMGITDYIWQDSGDRRVRPEHAANNGMQFQWASPPSTGHPGQEIQCRCVALPVIPEQPKIT